MDWWTDLDKWTADYLPDLRMACDEPMSRHTSFRIGGPARRMAFPERGEQLVLLLGLASACGARPAGHRQRHQSAVRRTQGLDRLVIDTSAGMGRVEAGEEPGPSDGRGRRLPGPAGGLCLPAGAGGPGVRPRHPRHCGRRGVHERRRLRRGDEAGGPACRVLFPEEGVRTLCRRGAGLRLPPQPAVGPPGRGGARTRCFALDPGDPAAIRDRMRGADGPAARPASPWSTPAPAAPSSGRRGTTPGR